MSKLIDLTGQRFRDSVVLVPWFQFSIKIKVNLYQEG